MKCRYLNYEWDCRVEIEDDKITIMFQIDDFPIEPYTKNFEEVPIIEVTTGLADTGIGKIETDRIIGFVNKKMASFGIFGELQVIITGKIFKNYYRNTNIKSIEIEVFAQTGEIVAINIYPA